MNDICRIISQFPESKDNVSIALIEISPTLKQVQQKLLCEQPQSNTSRYGFPIHWYNNLDELSFHSGFSVFLAHEFFDALPIHKFKRDANGEWREVLIDLERTTDSSSRLRYVLSRHATPASKAYVPHSLKANDFEMCPDAVLLMNAIAKRLNSADGLLLTCDYGFSRLTEREAIVRDTFRSFRNHQQWNPLSEPGSADLTADVDFDFLERLVRKQATCFGPITQKQFLLCLGAHIRLAQLMRKATDEQTRQQLQSGLRMLLQDMGEKFKFFAVFPEKSAKIFENDPPAAFHTTAAAATSKVSLESVDK
jgi:NADH dehydrogenase [ubiquinone] 1 alpha subcomplex assembly factor 7